MARREPPWTDLRRPRRCLCQRSAPGRQKNDTHIARKEPALAATRRRQACRIKGLEEGWIEDFGRHADVRLVADGARVRRELGTRGLIGELPLALIALLLRHRTRLAALNRRHLNHGLPPVRE